MSQWDTSFKTAQDLFRNIQGTLGIDEVKSEDMPCRNRFRLREEKGPVGIDSGEVRRQDPIGMDLVK